MDNPQMDLNKIMVEALDQQSRTATKMLDAMIAMAEKMRLLEERIFEVECQLQVVGPAAREKAKN